MREVQGQRAFAFVATFVVVLLYALRNGSYDVVARHEQAIVALWILVLGLALGLLPRRRPSLVALLPFAGFALLALLTGIALTSTSSQEQTGIELARVLHHAALYALPLCLLSRRTWTAAAAGVAAGALAISMLAVLARLDPQLIASDRAAQAFHTNRLSYPLGYWNAMGAWSATAVALGLTWSAHARSRWASALALAFVPWAVLALYLTYSRAGIVSLVVGVITIGALSQRRFVLLLNTAAAAIAAAAAVLVARGQAPIADATGTGGRGAVLLVLVLSAVALAGWTSLTQRVVLGTGGKKVARGALVTAAAVVVILAIAFGPHLARQAYDSYRRPLVVTQTTNPAARLTNLSGNRHDVWVAALAAYRSEPLSGMGPGTFGFYWNQHGANAEFLHDAHSIYLEALAELGWPGLLAVLVLLGGLAAVVVPARRRASSAREAGAVAGVAATLAVFAVSAGVDWMWESTANATLALASIGVCAAGLSRRNREAPSLVVRLPLAVLTLMALLVLLPALAATKAERSSQTAVRAGDLAKALEKANDAVQAEPWAATAYLQRALVLEREKRLGPALADIRQAIRREPLNFETHLIAYRLQTEVGNHAAARREYATARRLRPHSSIFVQLTAPAVSP